jgi:flagellar protein FliO/FliZ
VLSGFGIEASQATQYVIAFVIILVLVALFGLVLRRLTGGRLMLPGQERGRARQPRLGIVDIYDLDRQRQLILLRRDNVEHLLLIGGPNDVVIETNIVRTAGARLPSASADQQIERAEPALDRAPEAARPQIEAGGRSSIEAQLAARLGSFVGRPGDERAEGDEGDGAAPARVEPVLKPSAVTLATPSARPPVAPPAAPAAHPFPAPAAAPMPAPPRAPLGGRPESAPPVRPVPSAAPSRPPEPPVRPVPRSEPRPVTPPPAPPAPPPARPAPPERNAEAAVLSDMAKQLEEALRRPPAPPAPTPNRVLPALDDSRREDENAVAPPQRPAPQPPAPPRPQPMRAEPVRPEPVRPEPPRPEPARTESPRAEPARSEPQRAEPPRPEPSRPTPVPPPPPAPPRAAPPPPPAPPPPAPPAQQSRPVDDPFSVDEIEAEFARLLGRPGGNGKT